MAKNYYRVIVTGSREWDKRTPIEMALLGLKYMHGSSLLVVHGAARGADRIAANVCKQYGIRQEPHPADWVGEGLSAGPLRNERMLALGADLVLAYKNRLEPGLTRGGTEHMIRIALAAGVPVIRHQEVHHG